MRFDPKAPFDASTAVPFQERFDWGREIGASYFLGIDGIAILLIVLTTLICVLAIIWSWDTVNTRAREYYIAVLLLETGMLGVFVSLDLFLFYIFWEVMLIPMALLIGIWGSTNRVYAAVKFFLYTLFGSLLMLVGIVATYWAYYQETGTLTLNVLQLSRGTTGGNSRSGSSWPSSSPSRSRFRSSPSTPGCRTLTSRLRPPPRSSWPRSC